MEPERLILRRFIEDDRREFKELIRDKTESVYARYDEQYPTDDAGIENLLGYFISTDEFYAVVEKKSFRLIGFIAFNIVSDGIRNLGYCIRSDFQNMGFAT